MAYYLEIAIPVLAFGICFMSIPVGLNFDLSARSGLQYICLVILNYLNIMIFLIKYLYRYCDNIVRMKTGTIITFLLIIIGYVDIMTKLVKTSVRTCRTVL